MIQEAADHWEVLKMIHGTIDKMTDELTDEQWLFRPHDSWNNIASIIGHICRVERKFMSAVAGETIDVDMQAPFQASEWDLSAIRKEWKDTLAYSQSVLAQVSEESLTQPGLTLRSGPLNRRQLIVYAIGHAAHHRGQIPLVIKSM